MALSPVKPTVSTWRWAVLAFVGAAALRVGWVSVRYAGPERCVSLQYPDEEAYCLAGESLAAGRGLVDEFGFRATYMPAYAGFIALFQALPWPRFWARVVQALIGALVAPATFVLAVRWSRLCGRSGEEAGAAPVRVACLAGGLAAVDPFLVLFSGLLLTETLFAAALVALWACLLPMMEKHGSGRLRRSIMTGVLLWVCIMLRPSSAVLGVLALGGLIVCRRCDLAGVKASAVVVLTVLVLLFPWALRNRQVVGQWVWLTTRGGISLYDGLRADATGASDLAHTKSMPEVAGLDEVQWDAYFRARARLAAREDPLRVVRLGWGKLCRTWSLTPNVETYRRGPAAVVSVAWMVALLVSAAAGWWRHRSCVRAWVLLLLPVVGLTLLHMVFVGSVRYRVPAMPMVMVFSAAGAAGWFGWARGRHAG